MTLLSVCVGGLSKFWLLIGPTTFLLCCYTSLYLKVIPLHPHLLPQNIAYSEHKKLFFTLLCFTHQQLNDSSVIISTLKTFLISRWEYELNMIWDACCNKVHNYYLSVSHNICDPGHTWALTHFWNAVDREKTIPQILQCYPEMKGTNDSGKEVVEFTNKYWIMVTGEEEEKLYPEKTARKYESTCILTHA